MSTTRAPEELNSLFAELTELDIPLLKESIALTKKLLEKANDSQEHKVGVSILTAMIAIISATLIYPLANNVTVTALRLKDCIEHNSCYTPGGLLMSVAELQDTLRSWQIGLNADIAIAALSAFIAIATAIYAYINHNRINSTRKILSELASDPEQSNTNINFSTCLTEIKQANEAFDANPTQALAEWKSQRSVSASTEMALCIFQKKKARKEKGLPTDFDLSRDNATDRLLLEGDQQRKGYGT